jgi:hypothetical protein
MTENRHGNPPPNSLGIASKNQGCPAVNPSSSGSAEAGAMVAGGLSPDFDQENWLQPIEIVEATSGRGVPRNAPVERVGYRLSH